MIPLPLDAQGGIEGGLDDTYTALLAPPCIPPQRGGGKVLPPSFLRRWESRTPTSFHLPRHSGGSRNLEGSGRVSPFAKIRLKPAR